jgi:hypothetical protein
MKEFILDKNVDLKEGQKEYPKYFFDDLRKPAKVRLVMGGTDYRREVREKSSLLELISALMSSGKVRIVADLQVDNAQSLLAQKIVECVGECPDDCDDHHIFALALVSGCLNIITKDTRMASCRNQIRNPVGHDYCADVRIVSTEASYKDTP